PLSRPARASRRPGPPMGGRPPRRRPLGREAAPRPGTRRFRAPPAARLRIPSYPLPIEAAIIGRRDQGGSRLAALEAPAPRSRPAGPVPPRRGRSPRRRSSRRAPRPVRGVPRRERPLGERSLLSVDRGEARRLSLRTARELSGRPPPPHDHGGPARESLRVLSEGDRGLLRPARAEMDAAEPSALGRGARARP